MRSRRLWITVIASAGVVVIAFRLLTGHSANPTVVRLRAQGLPTHPSELDRWYVAVPPSNNLALAVLQATAAYQPARSLTNPFASSEALPVQPVDPQVLSRWQVEITQNKAVLEAIAAGRGRTGSRYPINLRMGFNSMLPHLGSLKKVAQFLALAALVDAESGHPAGAVRQIQDTLLVARSLEPEPTIISQLVRIVVIQIAAKATALLPGTGVDEAGWKTLQEGFAAAEATNAFRNGLIGEVAMTFGVTELPPAESGAFVFGNASTNMEVRLSGLLYTASGVRAADEGFCLDRLGEMLEASAQPFPEVLRRSDEINKRIETEASRFARGFKILSHMILPGLGNCLEKQAIGAATVRTAMVGCAIERHRLVNAGHLPETLADLVPAFLPAIPTDPFDGQPLRFRRTNDTYVLYSVGPDRLDQGGETRPSAVGVPALDDIGFHVAR